jgi:hypothetical protein
VGPPNNNKKNNKEQGMYRQQEDIWAEQKMLASINTLRDRLPYAIAGSRVGKMATEVPRELYTGVEKIFSGESLKIKNLRKGIDENSQLVLDSLSKIATGEGSWQDISHTVMEIGKNTKEFLGKVKSEMGDKVKEAGVDLKKSPNEIINIISTGVNTLSNTVTGTNTTIPAAVTPNTLPTATNNQIVSNETQSNTNTRMVVDFNLNLTSNQVIDEKQLAVMFENTGVKQKMIEVIKTGGFNGGLTGGNSSKQKQMIT